MSNFQQWASGDTAPWTKVNENFEAMAGLSLYAFNKDGSSGLVYGLMGGIFKDTVKAATTTTLADNTTNYVVANLTTGAITDATTTTNWDDEATYARVAKVTTSGGQITAVVDYRHDEFGLFSLIGGAAAASSSAAAFNSATAFDAFGDSITDGTGASSGANEYVSLIASGRGWTATNHGTSGDMVADHADDVFAESIGDGHQCTLMLGTNDQRTYTTNTYRQGAFKVGHMALAAWLAIPEARKQKGQGRDSVTGTWTNNAEYGGALGIQSIVPASTATFTTYPAERHQRHVYRFGRWRGEGHVSVHARKQHNHHQRERSHVHAGADPHPWSVGGFALCGDHRGHCIQR
jgi:hypothetical protein